MLLAKIHNTAAALAPQHPSIAVTSWAMAALWGEGVTQLSLSSLKHSNVSSKWLNGKTADKSLQFSTLKLLKQQKCAWAQQEGASGSPLCEEDVQLIGTERSSKWTRHTIYYSWTLREVLWMSRSSSFIFSRFFVQLLNSSSSPAHLKQTTFWLAAPRKQSVCATCLDVCNMSVITRPAQKHNLILGP